MKLSPLAYPGGKYRLAARICKHIERVCAGHGVDTLVDPMCGGAWVPLYALRHGLVRWVRLNDGDPHIGAFWSVVATDPTPIIDRWYAYQFDYEELAWWASRMYPLATRVRSISPEDAAFWRCVIRMHNWCGCPMSGSRSSGAPRFISRWAVRNRLRAAHRLLRRSLIGGECTAWDWSRVVAEDIPRSAISTDPPYQEAKQMDLYGLNFGPVEHRTFRSYLLRERRPLVVTYGDDAQTRIMYASWCDLERHPRHRSMATPCKEPDRRREQRADLIITPRRGGFRVEDPSGWARSDGGLLVAT